MDQARLLQLLFGSLSLPKANSIRILRYTEEVCYWEGPLSEVPLYFRNFCFFHVQEVYLYFPLSNLILKIDFNKMS